MSVSGGCQHRGLRGDPCADIPCGAVPAPAGTYRDQWHADQSARADRDSFVFYQYEWLGESDQLSPFGERHLERAVLRAAHCPQPLVVQRSGDPELDQRRVAAIQAVLTDHDPAWRDYPVVVSRPEAEPLYGFESPRVLRGFTGRGTGGTGRGMSGMGGIGGGMGGTSGGMGGGVF